MSRSNSQRILITGALGHIGSRLLHTLHAGEFTEVVLLDNLATQRYYSLFNLPDGVPFRFVEGDVCTDDLQPLIYGMDAVIHLAALTNAAGSFAIRDQIERVNFEGTQRIADACAAAHARLLLVSTTSVYGVSDGTVDEACPPDQLNPQSPYAESKLHAEHYLAELQHTRGLRFVTCRLGTIYGTSIGMRFHTAINKFVWQAIMGRPLSVWKTALHQRRPYLDLTDAVRAMRFILQTDCFNGDTYNIVSENLTVAEIVEAIRQHVPDLHVEFVESAIMNQLSYSVSAEKFRRAGFEFQGSFKNGIYATVQWLRNANALPPDGRMG
jgi:UDP-glucose 4-epimerase